MRYARSAARLEHCPAEGNLRVLLVRIRHLDRGAPPRQIFAACAREERRGEQDPRRAHELRLDLLEPGLREGGRRATLHHQPPHEARLASERGNVTSSL